MFSQITKTNSKNMAMFMWLSDHTVKSIVCWIKDPWNDNYQITNRLQVKFQQKRNTAHTAKL